MRRIAPRTSQELPAPATPAVRPHHALARRRPAALARVDGGEVQLTLGAAIGLLLGTEVLVYGISLWATVLSLAVGTLVGVAWDRAEGRPMRVYVALGLGFLVLRAMCGPGPLTQVLAAAGLVLVGGFGLQMAFQRGLGRVLSRPGGLRS